MGQKAVIFDVDGTLFDPSHRLHHLNGEKNWKAFHDAMEHDPVIENIATLARVLYQAIENGSDLEALLIVTARHNDPAYEQMTIEALANANVKYHAMYMRENNDYRPDHVVKQSILEKMIEDGYEPVLAIDDRPAVIKMWRDYGITALQCAPDSPGATPYAGQTLLHMLIGPCGSGKSTYAAKTYQPHEVISTDQIRMQLYGRLNNSPEALARTWRYVHGLIKARMDAGIFTVLDATNIDGADRAAILALIPTGIFTRYIVIDRDIDQKINEREWRPEDMVLKQHRKFKAEEKSIMAGDDHPYVTVQKAKN